MKNYPWILLAGGLVGMAFAQGACSSSGTGGSGGSGATGGTSSSSSSSTSTSTSSSSTSTSTSTGSSSTSSGTGSSSTSSGTGGGSCEGTGWFTDPACDTCMTGSCCTEINDCLPDSDCSGCADGTITDSATCQGSTTFSALATCFQGPCNSACVPKSVCNPVTNVGCTGAGEACDLSGTTNVFVCFPPPNDAVMCAACSNANGPFCAPGFRCNEDTNGGQCSHYCCTDGDCGTGTCDMTGNFPSGVGVCLGKATDAGASLASCDSPATPPSGGSCYAP